MLYEMHCYKSRPSKQITLTGNTGSKYHCPNYILTVGTLMISGACCLVPGRGHHTVIVLGWTVQHWTARWKEGIQTEHIIFCQIGLKCLIFHRKIHHIERVRQYAVTYNNITQSGETHCGNIRLWRCGKA